MNSLSVDQPISGLEVLVQKEAFRFCSLWQKAIRILSNFNEFSLKFSQAFKLNFNSKPSLHFIVFEPSNGDSIEFEIIDSKLSQLIICVIYWLQTPIDWGLNKKKVIDTSLVDFLNSLRWFSELRLGSIRLKIVHDFRFHLNSTHLYNAIKRQLVVCIGVKLLSTALSYGLIAFDHYYCYVLVVRPKYFKMDCESDNWHILEAKKETK